ncbi:pseudaminic acid synthase [Pseudohalioglobus lutimaris]|uniref:Pseudaminic acid synthase n=1 Tax=Pseudohalioglobus lutimaris TaxID=1737061 RepID=A0A2N5X6Z6_9GAMM|nr:pseudaminic acid synthase [Pseudohalioglobus lutimaris]PLW70247.1 pseudaminic acid synthase [Pseudohalioglobus lutimaris]
MIKDEFTIGQYRIGENHPPFIIAEMSGNHNQSLDKALKIVDAAADAGAHALKIQTYKPETMTLDLAEGDFFIDDPDSLWKKRSLFELYGEAMTPWEWHEPIMKRCEEKGIIFFSTPFDATAVDFLEELDVPFYKIASFENVDLPLIRRVSQTGKPVIISTGMATVSEISEAVSEARAAGCASLCLLKCTSAYPATPKDANLLTIPNMRETFGVEVGLSDHTMGIGVAIASVAFGAAVIEKHFTIDRAEGGVDSAFSMEPAEFKMLVEECKTAWEAKGEVSYALEGSERGSMIFRRSIYIAEDVQPGETLTASNMRCIRPGYGLPPKYYDLLLGRKVRRHLKKGTPISWDVLS